ncbi:glycosyltransferase [Dactylosporangium sp. NPDC051485]|uniref:glycosyltransferase family 2 protein n=1 Tax=Dactylosporangium sp. NPDC051485 TaxID=3154846 RepID=UPI003449AF7B
MNISVVIPVRNRPGCIRWTLSSLCSQRGAGDFEVVVVDDGSIDNTPGVVEEFRDRLTIKFLRNGVNRGRSFSRNRGAEAADGDYLLLLDSDSFVRQDLVSRHQRCHATWSGEVVMGRRIEIGWWSMRELALKGEVEKPQCYEGDQRDSWGLSEVDPNYIDRTPWLFAATHNLSLPRDLLTEVGGFDEGFRRWGYEDNEFAYKVFQRFGRESGHFWYEPEAVCYHMPHFRDWYDEWENTKPLLARIKDSHRHFDMELLNHPPNHLRIAQTIPYYEQCIAHVRDNSARTAVQAVQSALPVPAGEHLWIGCGTDALGPAPGVLRFDHAEPHGPDNPHLLGMALPFPDSSLSALINVDLWRLLTPLDLSAFVMEATRAAEVVYLAMSKDIGDEPARALGLMSSFDYLAEMLSGFYTVDKCHDGPAVSIAKISRAAP